MNLKILNDGNEIPSLGFGSYKADGTEGVEAMNFAIKSGCRLIDTAEMYGNEQEVGEVIRNCAIPRADFFITSKLWRDHLGYNGARKHFEISLKKLGLDYLDLYLIHWPSTAKQTEAWEKVNAETWKAFEDMQSEGLIKSIGVSNFLTQHLESLLKTVKIIPAVNQIEFHPGYWQQETFEFCRRHAITIQAWSPLARGKILDNQTLKAIAHRYQKTEAQITLRWITQKGCIPIPKSNTQARIQENLDIFDFQLNDDDISLIDHIPESGFSGYHPDFV